MREFFSFCSAIPGSGIGASGTGARDNRKPQRRGELTRLNSEALSLEDAPHALSRPTRCPTTNTSIFRTTSNLRTDIYFPRFSRDKPRLTDTLDVIKFLCKDLWTMIFRKQIDNLKTNHRGIYVLTDNSFKPLSKMSLEKGEGEQSLSKAQPVCSFPRALS